MHPFLCHYFLKRKIFYGISVIKPYLYRVIKFRVSISQRLLPRFLITSLLIPYTSPQQVGLYITNLKRIKWRNLFHLPNEIWKRKNKKSVFVTEEELDFYESDAKNEETALSNIGVERLKQALRRLPKEYYDVLMLNVKFGCSLSEMSGILGISYQAVRYKLRKARSILLKETEVKNEQH